MLLCDAAVNSVQYIKNTAMGFISSFLRLNQNFQLFNTAQQNGSLFFFFVVNLCLLKTIILAIKMTVSGIVLAANFVLAAHAEPLHCLLARLLERMTFMITILSLFCALFQNAQRFRTQLFGAAETQRLQEYVKNSSLNAINNYAKSIMDNLQQDNLAKQVIRGSFVLTNFLTNADCVV